jgi:signal transduction histidine kinase
LLPARVAVPTLVVAFGALEAIAVVAGEDGGNLAVLTAFAAFYGMLFLAFRLSEANQQAELLLAELRQSNAARAEAVVLAERQRVAREMHDVLAHSLSGLMLQLEGARMLAVEDAGDPRLPQILERAHRLGRAGLDEARHAIGMLRDDELPGPQRLAGLAAQFQEDRDIPCRLTVSGEAHELDSQARLTLYRVAQEALTNVTKHARAEWVELRLTYEECITRLAVEDFASVRERGDGGGGASDGYGLTGMRERAELLGGTLTAESTDHGYRVVLDVPA